MINKAYFNKEHFGLAEDETLIEAQEYLLSDLEIILNSHSTFFEMGFESVYWKN